MVTASAPQLLLSLLLLLCSAGAARGCDLWSPGEPASGWTCHSHQSNDDCADSADNTLGIMADPNQQITSAGTLTAWDYYAHRKGKTSLQIWRPTSSSTGFKGLCMTPSSTPFPTP